MAHTSFSSPSSSGSRSSGRTGRLVLLAAASGVTAAAVALGTAAAVSAAPAPVDLGSATSFAVLAGSTVTNTGPTTVRGDLGVHPGTAVTGFPPGTVVDGTIHAGDPVAAQAKADLTTAYNDVASRAATGTITADLGGQTLVPGVYVSAGPSLSLTGTLTLDAQGDPAAVFIFKAGSTLTTASASRVELLNGASSCNVFWQVGSSATLGTSSTFVGTILAQSSITATSGAAVQGRLLAREAAVTLDDNAVSRLCVTAALAPSPSPSFSPPPPPPPTTPPPTTAPPTTAPPTVAPTAAPPTAAPPTAAPSTAPPTTAPPTPAPTTPAPTPPPTATSGPTAAPPTAPPVAPSSPAASPTASASSAPDQGAPPFPPVDAPPAAPSQGPGFLPAPSASASGPGRTGGLRPGSSGDEDLTGGGDLVLGAGGGTLPRTGADASALGLGAATTLVGALLVMASSGPRPGTHRRRRLSAR